MQLSGDLLVSSPSLCGELRAVQLLPARKPPPAPTPRQQPTANIRIPISLWVTPEPQQRQDADR
eukprot:3926232-Rhodomonas_salina.1